MNWQFSFNRKKKKIINFFFCFFFFLSKIKNNFFQSAWFKKQNSNLAQIKVNEMFCFVGNIRTKISSNDAMPSRIIFLIKFFFDECCNILFNVEFFKGLISTIHGIALHILSHIRIFNNCFSVGHYWKIFFFLFEDFKFKKISFINFLFFHFFNI